MGLKGFVPEVRHQCKDTMNLPVPLDTADGEAQLIAAAAEGSAPAFTQLFNRYYPMIHAFAYRLSLCPAEAGDIAQDTFIQAARALGGFRREASFKNWLYTIAANKSRDRHRQKSRREKLTADYAQLNVESVESAESVQTVAVREALAGLSPEMREAVTLVYYEGLNHAETARILGCAETTISWRLFRAKQKLKHALQSAPAGGAHE
jgi:RNA polymerase sigma-70 factor, ECF subfamily